MNKIKAIVAITKNNGIGYQGDLLYRFPKDMNHFKKKTTGDVVIMGSKTYESIPKKFRPLKGRTNIVLSRNPNKKYPGEDVLIISNIESALAKARGHNTTIWIIGGSEIYKQTLPYISEIEVTQIFEKSGFWGLFKKRKEADVFFPEFENQFELTEHSKKFSVERGVKIQFQTWERKQ